MDAAPLHYFCGEQGHQPPSLPSAGQGKGPQHLAALAPTGARVGRAPSGHLSPAKLAALRGDGSFRQSRNPPVIESTVDILTVRTETDFKTVCTVENLGLDPWREDMLCVCRRFKEGPKYPAAMAAASSAIEEGCTSLQQLGGRHGTYFSPDDEAMIRNLREILIRTPRGREMVEAVAKKDAEKAAAQREQKRPQAVTEKAADKAADRREKEVKGTARRGNKKLTKWVITAEALPRKECSRQGCHKRAVFTCGASGSLLCSKSCQHRRKKWGKGERVPELQKGTGSWCAGRHSRRKKHGAPSP